MNFPSWMALYEFLKKQGYADDSHVSFIPPQPPIPTLEVRNAKKRLDTIKEIKIDVRQVKAWAFDELYEQLPSTPTRDILIDIAEDLQHFHPDAGFLLSFLNKIQTRLP